MTLVGKKSTKSSGKTGPQRFLYLSLFFFFFKFYLINQKETIHLMFKRNKSKAILYADNYY